MSGVVLALLPPEAVEEEQKVGQVVGLGLLAAEEAYDDQEEEEAQVHDVVGEDDPQH